VIGDVGPMVGEREGNLVGLANGAPVGKAVSMHVHGVGLPVGYDIYMKEE